MKKKVLVYGGTGAQGGAVVKGLLSSGHTPYVATRNPSNIKEGPDAVKADLADINSLRQASAGMDAVSLMIPAFLENPMEGPAYARNAITAAKEAGVSLIVYNTSGPVVPQRIGHPIYDGKWEIIDALQESGLPHIIIQPTAYMENWLGPWTRNRIISADEFGYPAPPQVRIGWIAVQDVGNFVAAAIERPELSGEWYTVSGLENPSGPELAQQFSDGVARQIVYHHMPYDDFEAAIDQAFGPGAGAPIVAGYKFQAQNADLFNMWTDMTPVLEKLPVEMTSIADWARQHRHLFEPEAVTDAPTKR